MRLIGNPASGRRGRKNVKIWYNPYKRRMEGGVRKKNESQTHTQTKLPCSHSSEDGEWIGDNMEELPHQEHTRFILSNCHGLKTQHDTNFLKSQVQSYLSTGAHFTALTEVNYNVRRPGNRQKVINVIIQPK